MPTQPVRVRIALVLCLFAGFGLIACGSSGDSDEDQINDAVNRAFLENDPAICDEIATQSFIDELFDGSIENCKMDTEDDSDNPDSVEVTELEVDGDKATAKVTTVGGPDDGSSIAFSFLKEDGDWKFDGADLASVETGTETDAGTDTGAATTAPTDTTAQSGDALETLFYDTVRKQVISKGLSAEIADCIVNKLKATITPEELDQIKGGSRPGSVSQKATQAGRQCGQEGVSG